MSEKEKAEVMAALSDLPEEKKQFVLGYAAGIAAKSDARTEQADSSGREKEDEA